MSLRLLALCTASLAAASACGKSGSAGPAVISATEGVQPGVLQPMDSFATEAWARAAAGGEADQMRLADLAGCIGLRERGELAPQRPTAIRAMRYCDGFWELPWLASIAATGRDAEAEEALDSIVEQAARPRRATDPEDAQELATGCHALLDLSRSTAQPRSRRIKAVRALRMLSERGCVKTSEIPANID